MPEKNSLLAIYVPLCNHAEPLRIRLKAIILQDSKHNAQYPLSNKSIGLD